MRSVAKLAAFVAAAVVLTEPAEGQFRDYGTQCSMGPVRTCVSLSTNTNAISYDLFGNGLIPVTQLDIRVSNRQGSPGYEFDGWWQLHGLGFSNIFWDAVGPDADAFRRSGGPPVRGTLEGNAGGWALTQGLRIDGNGFFIENDPGLHYPLFGCNTDPEFSTGSYSAIGPSFTCGNGWLIWHVFLPGTAAITNDTRIFLPMDAGGSTTSGDGSCVVGDTCVAAVPEPATLALMGTGLASLVLARRRRKKQPG